MQGNYVLERENNLALLYEKLGVGTATVPVIYAELLVSKFPLLSLEAQARHLQFIACQWGEEPVGWEPALSKLRGSRFIRGGRQTVRDLYDRSNKVSVFWQAGARSDGVFFSFSN